LHILQWAREHGCDWDWQTCSEALRWNHLELLKWAIVSGCSMEQENDDDDDDDEDDEEPFNLCKSAVEKGYWDIVKLAWDHGCSCSDNIKLQCIQHQLQHQSTQHQRQLTDVQSQLQAIQHQLESSQQQQQQQQQQLLSIIQPQQQQLSDMQQQILSILQHLSSLKQ